MWPLTGLAALACRTSGYKGTLVLSEHNDFRFAPALRPREKNFLRLFGARIYAAASRVIAVSQGVKDSLKEVAKLPDDLVEVIHNPVEVSGATQFQESDRALVEWWRAGDASLLGVGTLKQQKGFDVLLDALKLVTAAMDVRLVIVGDGSLMNELKAQCNRLGLEEHVRLIGSRADPGPFYNAADLFVLSSRTEGFGNVIVEALAYGTPVVSARCSGSPAEILEGGRYGLLVPQLDPQALAHAILTQLSAPKREGELRQRAANFSPESAARKYLDLFG